MKTQTKNRFVICLENTGAEDLAVHKVYAVIHDEDAEKNKHVRVVDDSGEDYLYPKAYFKDIEIPLGLARQIRRTTAVEAR